RFSIYFDSPLTFGKFFYLLSFSFAFGWIVTLIACSFKRIVNQIIHIVTLVLLTVLFFVQYGYFHFFGAFFRWSTIGMAGDVTDFYRETFQMVKGNWFSFILLAMPLLLYIVSVRHHAGKNPASWAGRGIIASVVLLAYLIPVVVISGHTEDYGDHHFFNYLTPVESVDRFGLLTETRQDFSELLFGTKEIEVNLDDLTSEVVNPFTKTPASSETEPATSEPATGPADSSEVTTEAPPVPIEYGYNVLDIDWDALIAGEKDKTIRGMHEYFSTVTPTKQNEYTGLFAGKNLIFLTLEGFSDKVVELAPDLYPTMYKMIHEGFDFTHFYVSCWGGSTASGEYSNMTGLFYKDAQCLKNTADNYMPFVLGNQLRKAGYLTQAYHNWRAEYYSRHLSHENYGYDYYAYDPNKVLAKDRRLDFSGYISGSKGYDWPMSDDVLALLSLPHYIDSEVPFHAYYMTVSGHATYSWGGNAMSRKHREDVAYLPYSETVKAYIAANMEVELMLTRMCNALEERGILEDTVFVMCCDHYPYGLTYNAENDKYDYSYTRYLSELYGIPTENIMNNPELYRNCLIIWSASMTEPVVVDEPCSTIDILPTVSNLFGLDYDSRLFMGTDILSDSENLVILNCDGTGTAWNWINRYGYYSTATKVFTPNEGFTATQDQINAYVSQINSIVTAKKKYSWLVLEKDYYKYLKSYIE
ncbi:MAG: LTA synthase family protein, partial [Clostridia bacterium]|nr:LTA synthase family protein [Clostridia bacterium]